MLALCILLTVERISDSLLWLREWNLWLLVVWWCRWEDSGRICEGFVSHSIITLDRLWELLVLGAILCQPTVGPVGHLLSQDLRPFASHVLRRHRSRWMERSSVAEWTDLPRCSQTSGFRLRFYIVLYYILITYNYIIMMHQCSCRCLPVWSKAR